MENSRSSFSQVSMRTVLQRQILKNSLSKLARAFALSCALMVLVLFLADWQVAGAPMAGTLAALAQEGSEQTFPVVRFNFDNLVATACGMLSFLAVPAVGNTICGAIVAFAMRRKSLGGLVLAMCPVAALIGMVSPGSVWWVLTNARDSNIDERFLPVIVLPVLFAFYTPFIGIWFTPFIIARRTNFPHQWLLFIASFLAWLPFVWPIQLFLALSHANEMERQKAQAQVVEQTQVVEQAQVVEPTAVESTAAVETSSIEASPVLEQPQVLEQS